MAYKLAVLIFVAVGCVLCTVNAKTTGSFFDEPMCSKYHFEEHVLEKLIRLEIQVEQSNSLLNAEISDLKDENREIKLELASIKAELEQEKNSGAELRAELVTLKAEQKQDRDVIAKLAAELEAEKMAHEEDREKLKEELLGEIGTAKTSTSVAFVARNPSTSLPHKTPVPFRTTVLNSGSAYSSSTGKFTAPVSGTYMFSTQFCSVNIIQFQLLVNNHVLGVSRQHDAGSSGVCSSMSTVAVMQAGQQAWVSVASSSSKVVADDTNYYWNMFTGVLVNPN